MDLANVSLADLFAKGVTTTAFIIFLLYLLRLLWKRLVEVEDKRDKDSKENTETMTVALETVTDTLKDFKTILITLQKQNGQQKTENKD